MENKFRNKKLREIIRGTGGVFGSAVLLVLVPVLIVSCYSFYSVYGGFEMDYSSLDGVDMKLFFTGDITAVQGLQEALFKVFPDIAYEQSLGDIVLEIINIAILLFFDAFMIVIGVNSFFGKKVDVGQAAKTAVKKILIMLVINLLSTWVVYEVQNLLFSGIVMTASALYLKSPVFIYSSIASMAVILVLSVAAACWLMLYFYYMAIAAVSGRCRLMLSFGYAREVLRGNTLKRMLAVSPYIIFGLIIPIILQSVAILLAENMYAAIVLVAVNAVLQVVLTGLMWFKCVSDFMVLEEESGIQQKIQAMINKAMNMRDKSINTDENEENNGNDENNDEPEVKE